MGKAHALFPHSTQKSGRSSDRVAPERQGGRWRKGVLGWDSCQRSSVLYTLYGRMELHLQMASKGSLLTTLMDQRPVASLPSQNCVNLPKSLSCNTDNANSHSPRASLNLVFLLSMPSQAQGCKCQPESGHPRLVCAARTPPWSPHSFTGLLFDIWPSH